MHLQPWHSSNQIQIMKHAHLLSHILFQGGGGGEELELETEIRNH